MTSTRFLRRRPWMSAGLAGALVAVALLVVPFSYNRTIGHTVALTLSGGNLDTNRAAGIARQMKQVLHADGVALEMNAGDGGTTYTLSSTVPNAAGIDAAAAANAFAGELKRLGYGAVATVAPVKERVNGSAYAFVRDRVIEVSVDGKTAAQLEDEIRQGLANAGVPNAQVSVTRNDADGRHELNLTVDAQKTVTGPGAAEAPEVMPQLLLRQGDQPLGGKGFSVREELRRNAEGTTMTLHVQSDGKNVDITVPHSDTIGDAAIAAQVETQLRAAGIDATVSVTNGRVRFENHK
jgi:type IV pilus biogenesis protein CpaD/CtpE